MQIYNKNIFDTILTLKNPARLQARYEKSDIQKYIIYFAFAKIYANILYFFSIFNYKFSLFWYKIYNFV